jgi:NAD(P)-dependent dehydrogenase (short-subunit alcohol dehydrogenase family)
LRDPTDQSISTPYLWRFACGTFFSGLGMKLMKGKVCVVAGAPSLHGIGRATAHMLAANGAHVAVIDVSENVDNAAGDIAADHPSSSIHGVQCDIVNSAACEEAAPKVSCVFNQVDALIHCAGVIRSGRCDEISNKDFDEVIAVAVALPS